MSLVLSRKTTTTDVETGLITEANADAVLIENAVNTNETTIAALEARIAILEGA
jgi:hypothetical protein